MGEDDAIWPLSIPAIVTIPFAFALCWIGSLAGRSNPDAQGMRWEDIRRLGLGLPTVFNFLPIPAVECRNNANVKGIGGCPTTWRRLKSRRLIRPNCTAS